MTISLKNRKAEIYSAYVELQEENLLLKSELVDAHKTVYPMPISNYREDFQARYKITQKEIKLLFRDLKIGYEFLKEKTLKIANKEISLPPILKS
tara:strand:- start:39 stop:323 length:285 start_codon:yes stop_codon:yes gene_type:complete